MVWCNLGLNPGLPDHIYVYIYIYVKFKVPVTVVILCHTMHSHFLGSCIKFLSFYCFSYCVLYCWVLSKEVSSTIFKVFGMTQPGIEPRSPRPYICIYICKIQGSCHCSDTTSHHAFTFSLIMHIIIVFLSFQLLCGATGRQKRALPTSCRWRILCVTSV